ncbi:M56 family metallopeptidase [Salegentibacter salegens]|uniref:TonB-dependent outer membrane receptor, SusC/RagA subfamily, signature region n=1 Tax=Salegentibacter salegens TaxID=143223 RepID=A0A1M7NPW1_9FLAO|nr:M56 family metallopeptidase [Salegentibacter salegens]PRX40303.1 TonB-dependent SusC/RagA subfamily outer membrane receptor [Salegentibacter salegens]SHN05975.1 TonB-dependent outer membrane receptor, SusC/RagA subfamily, signature region [Salegentibacter salegens]
MEALLIYLFKSAGILTIFYLAYTFLLKNETSFQVNRRFLLGGILASAVLPAVYFTRKVIVKSNNFSLNEIPVSTNVSSEDLAATFGIWEVLGIVYSLVAAFFLIRIMLQLRQIFKLMQQRTIYKTEDVKFIKTDATISPFSFFKYIVYNPAAHSEKDLKMILQHEKIHAAQWHSVDILIANLTTALLWFNPLSWLYKKSVEQNLEYIADRETVALSGAKKSYQQALVKVSIANLQPALTNHFYQSFIKKRILMLNKKSNQNSGLWKISLVFPLILAFMLAFNVKTQASINPSENNKTFTINSEEDQKVLEAHFSENTSEADLDKYQDAFAEKLVKLEWRDLRYSANKLKNIHITYTLKTGDTRKFQSETDKDGNMLPFKIGAKFHENGKIAFISISNKKLDEPTNSQLVEREVESIENKKLPEDLVYKIDGKIVSMEDAERLNPDEIAEMQVLKGEKAINEAGKKGENGVILITTKTSKNPQEIPGNPLYILNGEKSKKEIIELIDKNLIKSVNVLKGESAISLYGEEAKNGAVIITTKILDESKKESEKKVIKIEAHSVGIQSFKKKTANEIMYGKEISFRTGEDINAFQWNKEPGETTSFYINDEEKIGPVVIIDGKKKNGATLKELAPKNIEKVNVLKGKVAIEKYGEEANYGAIEVTTRKEKDTEE